MARISNACRCIKKKKTRGVCGLTTYNIHKVIIVLIATHLFSHFFFAFTAQLIFKALLEVVFAGGVFPFPRTVHTATR